MGEEKMLLPLNTIFREEEDVKEDSNTAPEPFHEQSHVKIGIRA
jgi:hypothetical protein